jgi:outer membrane protein
MKAVKKLMVVAALGFVLAAGPVFAQTPPAGQTPPQNPPAQTPPAQTPPAAQQPAAQPQPPRPFPEGAKVAWVNIQAIASNSAEGKAATAKLDDLRKKKTAEIGEKNKQLQALQTKLQQGGTVLSDAARGQIEKDINKLTRDIQLAQQDAQEELQQLTNDLQGEFQQKLQPIIEAIAKERSLHFVFSIADSGAIWADTGLDISQEVIKRFDAARGTAQKK